MFVMDTFVLQLTFVYIALEDITCVRFISVF